MAEQELGLLQREEIVLGERQAPHKVFYTEYPIPQGSLAEDLLSYVANVLTSEANKSDTLLARSVEMLRVSGGLVFVFDDEGASLLEQGSFEQLTHHVLGLAHLGLFRRDDSNQETITDVEIRGLKAPIKGVGGGLEAIIAAAELARARFPKAQLFIMVKGGSEVAMEKLQRAGLLEYVTQDERDVPDVYFDDCERCSVRPSSGCRRCCHTVELIK